MPSARDKTVSRKQFVSYRQEGERVPLALVQAEALARQGDSEAILALERLRLNKFLQENKHLSREIDGLIVGFTVHTDRFLRMQVAIPEAMSARRLKAAAPDVIAWRNRLTEFQGESVKHAWNGLRFKLKAAKDSGASWGDLAHQCTQELAEDLEAFHRGKTALHRQMAGCAARSLLQAFGFNDDMCIEMLEEALTNLNNGLPVFGKSHQSTRRKKFLETSTPITAEKVRAFVQGGGRRRTTK
jgi:hypothetical protein